MLGLNSGMEREAMFVACVMSACTDLFDNCPEKDFSYEEVVYSGLWEKITDACPLIFAARWDIENEIIRRESANYIVQRFIKSIPTDKINEAKRLWFEIKKNPDFEPIVILLDCSTQELMRRFALTRHIHPNSVLAGIDLEHAIENDKAIVNDFIKDADLYIDTSQYTIKEFRTILYNKIESDNKKEITSVVFVSFGIKNGIQKDIDFMIDCRNLPNPYWIEALKEKNDLEKEIKDYLNSFPETSEFLNNTIAYLEYHLSRMQMSGRATYLIGVCCSGGHHRSPFVADYLANYFKKKYRTRTFHRDCPELNK